MTFTGHSPIRQGGPRATASPKCREGAPLRLISQASDLWRRSFGEAGGTTDPILTHAVSGVIRVIRVKGLAWFFWVWVMVGCR